MYWYMKENSYFYFYRPLITINYNNHTPLFIYFFFLQTAGVVLIYFLVLVQFQMEGYKQILGPNSSDAVVAVVCHSWPCLERDD